MIKLFVPFIFMLFPMLSWGQACYYDPFLPKGTPVMQKSILHLGEIEEYSRIYRVVHYRETSGDRWRLVPIINDIVPTFKSSPSEIHFFYESGKPLKTCKVMNPEPDPEPKLEPERPKPSLKTELDNVDSNYLQEKNLIPIEPILEKPSKSSLLSEPKKVFKEFEELEPKKTIERMNLRMSEYDPDGTRRPSTVQDLDQDQDSFQVLQPNYRKEDRVIQE